jgi:hypothetical protein
MSAAGLAFARLTPWSDERAHNPDGQQELHVHRETSRAVPADAVVEELPAAQTQEGEDVLEVGGGTRRGAKCRRIEWASPRGEQKDAYDAAADLEATRAEVLVRQAVAREVEDRPQEERRKSRPARRAGGGARGHVQRDDHGDPTRQIGHGPLLARFTDDRSQLTGSARRSRSPAEPADGA